MKGLSLAAGFFVQHAALPTEFRSQGRVRNETTQKSRPTAQNNADSEILFVLSVETHTTRALNSVDRSSAFWREKFRGQS